MIQGIPHPSVRVVDPQTGLMDVTWYRYFRARDGVGLSQLADVKLSSLSNGQVLVWNSTDQKWENGAN